MNNLLVHLLQFILPRQYWYRKFYLRSAHWRGEEPDGIKWRKLANENWTCEKCGTTAITERKTIDWHINLDVHHLTYYRNGKSILWHERLSDLKVLCRNCHRLEHNPS